MRQADPPQPVPPEGNPTAGLADLDVLLDHRVRLAILVLLTRWDRIAFTRLRELTGQTDGNLGAHLRRLEEARYLDVAKEFVARKPVSWYSITPLGRSALERHLRALELLIGQAR